MARWTFNITREVTITEGFSRTYEAASFEEAEAMAEQEAEEANMDCPDDCTEEGSGGFDSTSFAVTSSAALDEAATLLQRATGICRKQPGYGTPAYRGDPWEAVALQQQAARAQS
jgi:hypothetical protein